MHDLFMESLPVFFQDRFFLVLRDGEAAGLDTCFFKQIRLSIGHLKLVSINAPLFSEACCYLELRLT